MFRTIQAAALALILTGCGLDDLGVLSVHITLDPTGPELEDVPNELIGLIDVEETHGAFGTLQVDVAEGMIELEAGEIPDPPEGWVWVPVLTVEHSVLAGLPGSVNLDAGHAHGARGAGDETEDESSMVMLGALSLLPDGDWAVVQAGKKIGDKPIGAIRSVMVNLMREDLMMDGPSLMVLFGQASFEEDAAAAGEEEEAGGHAHGA